MRIIPRYAQIINLVLVDGIFQFSKFKPSKTNSGGGMSEEEKEMYLHAIEKLV